MSCLTWICKSLHHWMWAWKLKLWFSSSQEGRYTRGGVIKRFPDPLGRVLADIVTRPLSLCLTFCLRVDIYFLIYSIDFCLIQGNQVACSVSCLFKGFSFNCLRIWNTETDCGIFWWVEMHRHLPENNIASWSRDQCKEKGFGSPLWGLQLSLPQNTIFVSHTLTLWQV